MDIRYLVVDTCDKGWCLRWPDGDRYDSKTYKRSQDAKTALTLLLK